MEDLPEGFLVKSSCRIGAWFRAHRAKGAWGLAPIGTKGVELRGREGNEVEKVSFDESVQCGEEGKESRGGEGRGES